MATPLIDPSQDSTNPLWEELAGYKPTFSCTCEGLQQIHTHQEFEYVMSLLMGLNDSFSQIWGQILLSDPLPSIGNVFSLILQEEAQREIVVTHSPTNALDNIAFSVNSASKNQYDNTKGKYIKKERPKCAHCDMLGHTKDKCYKLVGYPPNYFKNHTNNSVNQIQHTPESSPPIHAPTLTATQCQ